MNENFTIITEGVRQSLDSTQKNALIITDLVMEVSNLSGKTQHDAYMQNLINCDMPIKERQKYMDHERRIHDLYIKKNFKRLEHIQKTQTRNTIHVSHVCYVAGAAAIIGVAAFTPLGRKVLSKVWRGIAALSA